MYAKIENVTADKFEINIYDDEDVLQKTIAKIPSPKYSSCDLKNLMKAALEEYQDSTDIQTILSGIEDTEFEINTCGNLEEIVPTGTILLFAGNTAPISYLECNGSSELRIDYPDLFNIIGTNYGAADGTHFNLPDLRGKFARGWDHGEGNDPDAGDRTAQDTGGNTGDNVGSVQTDEFKAHTHGIDMNGSSNTSAQANGASANVDYQQTGSTGGNETRPINVNVMYIIKT